jgi:hypothetical protein
MRMFPLVSRVQQIVSYTFWNGKIIEVHNFRNKPSLMKVYQSFSLHLAADVRCADVAFLLLTDRQDTSRVIIFTVSTSRARGAAVFLLTTIYFVTYIWGNHGFLQPLVSVTVVIHICHISFVFWPLSLLNSFSLIRFAIYFLSLTVSYIIVYSFNHFYAAVRIVVFISITRALFPIP